MVSLLKLSSLGFLVTVLLALGAWTCSGDITGPSGGRVLWRFDTAGWAVPSFDGAAVYFPTADHRLLALSKQSGKVFWSIEMPQVFGPLPPGSVTSGFGSSTAAGRVVAMDIVLFGFAAQTGELGWTFKPPLRIQDITLPASDGVHIFTATPGGTAYSLDAATGAVLWESFIGDTAAVLYSPVSAGDAVYISFTVRAEPIDSGGIVALRAATGERLWSFYFPRATPFTAPRGWIQPAVSGDLVLAPTEGTALFALDRQTGRVAWQGVPGELAGQGIGAVTGAPGRVFVGFNTGVVVALEATTGREIWRCPDIAFSVKRMIADHDQLYVNYAGPLGVIDIATGKLRWRTTFPLIASAIDGDRIYAAGSGGLYAISAR
jgi:outer membrane protein assembly factor BamB